MDRELDINIIYDEIQDFLSVYDNIEDFHNPYKVYVGVKENALSAVSWVRLVANDPSHPQHDEIKHDGNLMRLLSELKIKNTEYSREFNQSINQNSTNYAKNMVKYIDDIISVVSKNIYTPEQTKFLREAAGFSKYAESIGANVRSAFCIKYVDNNVEREIVAFATFGAKMENLFNLDFSQRYVSLFKDERMLITTDLIKYAMIDVQFDVNDMIPINNSQILSVEHPPTIQVAVLDAIGRKSTPEMMREFDLFAAVHEIHAWVEETINTNKRINRIGLAIKGTKLDDPTNSNEFLLSEYFRIAQKAFPITCKTIDIVVYYYFNLEKGGKKTARRQNDRDKKRRTLRAIMRNHLRTKRRKRNQRNKRKSNNNKSRKKQ